MGLVFEVNFVLAVKQFLIPTFLVLINVLD